MEIIANPAETLPSPLAIASSMSFEDDLRTRFLSGKRNPDVKFGVLFGVCCVVLLLFLLGICQPPNQAVAFNFSVGFVLDGQELSL